MGRKCIKQGQNLINTLKQSTNFPAPIFTKLVTAQWHYLEMYIRFYPNWSGTVESMVQIHLHTSVKNECHKADI